MAAPTLVSMDGGPGGGAHYLAAQQDAWAARVTAYAVNAAPSVTTSAGAGSAAAIGATTAKANAPERVLNALAFLPAGHALLRGNAKALAAAAAAGSAAAPNSVVDAVLRAEREREPAAGGFNACGCAHARAYGPGGVAAFGPVRGFRRCDTCATLFSKELDASPYGTCVCDECWRTCHAPFGHVELTAVRITSEVANCDCGILGLCHRIRRGVAFVDAAHAAVGAPPLPLPPRDGVAARSGIDVNTAAAAAASAAGAERAVAAADRKYPAPSAAAADDEDDDGDDADASIESDPDADVAADAAGAGDSDEKRPRRTADHKSARDRESKYASPPPAAAAGASLTGSSTQPAAAQPLNHAEMQALYCDGLAPAPRLLPVSGPLERVRRAAAAAAAARAAGAAAGPMAPHFPVPIVRGSGSARRCVFDDIRVPPLTAADEISLGVPVTAHRPGGPATPQRAALEALPVSSVLTDACVPDAVRAYDPYVARFVTRVMQLGTWANTLHADDSDDDGTGGCADSANASALPAAVAGAAGAPTARARSRHPNTVSSAWLRDMPSHRVLLPFEAVPPLPDPESDRLWQRAIDDGLAVPARGQSFPDGSAQHNGYTWSVPSSNSAPGAAAGALYGGGLGVPPALQFASGLRALHERTVDAGWRLTRTGALPHAPPASVDHEAHREWYGAHLSLSAMCFTRDGRPWTAAWGFGTTGVPAAWLTGVDVDAPDAAAGAGADPFVAFCDPASDPALRAAAAAANGAASKAPLRRAASASAAAAASGAGSASLQALPTALTAGPDRTEAIAAQLAAAAEEAAARSLGVRKAAADAAAAYFEWCLTQARSAASARATVAAAYNNAGVCQLFGFGAALDRSAAYRSFAAAAAHGSLSGANNLAVCVALGWGGGGSTGPVTRDVTHARALLTRTVRSKQFAADPLVIAHLNLTALTLMRLPTLPLPKPFDYAAAYDERANRALRPIIAAAKEDERVAALRACSVLDPPDGGDASAGTTGGGASAGAEAKAKAESAESGDDLEARRAAARATLMRAAPAPIAFAESRDAYGKPTGSLAWSVPRRDDEDLGDLCPFLDGEEDECARDGERRSASECKTADQHRDAWRELAAAHPYNFALHVAPARALIDPAERAVAPFVSAQHLRSEQFADPSPWDGGGRTNRDFMAAIRALDAALNLRIPFARSATGMPAIVHSGSGVAAPEPSRQDVKHGPAFAVAAAPGPVAGVAAALPVRTAARVATAAPARRHAYALWLAYRIAQFNWHCAIESAHGGSLALAAKRRTADGVTAACDPHASPHAKAIQQRVHHAIWRIRQRVCDVLLLDLCDGAAAGADDAAAAAAAAATHSGAADVSCGGGYIPALRERGDVLMAFAAEDERDERADGAHADADGLGVRAAKLRALARAAYERAGLYGAADCAVKAAQCYTHEVVHRPPPQDDGDAALFNALRASHAEQLRLDRRAAERWYAVAATHPLEHAARGFATAQLARLHESSDPALNSAAARTAHGLWLQAFAEHRDPGAALRLMHTHFRAATSGAPAPQHLMPSADRNMRFARYVLERVHLTHHWAVAALRPIRLVNTNQPAQAGSVDDVADDAGSLQTDDHHLVVGKTANHLPAHSQDGLGAPLPLLLAAASANVELVWFVATGAGGGHADPIAAARILQPQLGDQRLRLNASKAERAKSAPVVGSSSALVQAAAQVLYTVAVVHFASGSMYAQRSEQKYAELISVAARWGHVEACHVWAAMRERGDAAGARFLLPREPVVLRVCVQPDGSVVQPLRLITADDLKAAVAADAAAAAAAAAEAKSKPAPAAAGGTAGASGGAATAAIPAAAPPAAVAAPSAAAASMPGGGLVSRELLTDAWRAYLAAAESGHVASMWRVTESYFTGDLAAPDPVRALEWFNRAAAVTTTASLFELGKHQMADDAVANKRRALLLLDAAAQRGHAEATFLVGNAYAHGVAVDGAPARNFKDMKKAGDYWEAAARLGWGPAKTLITPLLRKRQKPLLDLTNFEIKAGGRVGILDADDGPQLWPDAPPGDALPENASTLRSVDSVAMDADQNVFVADAKANIIWKLHSPGAARRAVLVALLHTAPARDDDATPLSTPQRPMQGLVPREVAKVVLSFFRFEYALRRFAPLPVWLGTPIKLRLTIDPATGALFLPDPLRNCVYRIAGRADPHDTATQRAAAAALPNTPGNKRAPHPLPAASRVGSATTVEVWAGDEFEAGAQPYTAAYQKELEDHGDFDERWRYTYPFAADTLAAARFRGPDTVWFAPNGAAIVDDFRNRALRRVDPEPSEAAIGAAGTNRVWRLDLLHLDVRATDGTALFGRAPSGHPPHDTPWWRRDAVVGALSPDATRDTALTAVARTKEAKAEAVARRLVQSGDLRPAAGWHTGVIWDIASHELGNDYSVYGILGHAVLHPGAAPHHRHALPVGSSGQRLDPHAGTLIARRANTTDQWVRTGALHDPRTCATFVSLHATWISPDSPPLGFCTLPTPPPPPPPADPKKPKPAATAARVTVAPRAEVVPPKSLPDEPSPAPGPSPAPSPSPPPAALSIPDDPTDASLLPPVTGWPNAGDAKREKEGKASDPKASAQDREREQREREAHLSRALQDAAALVTWPSPHDAVHLLAAHRATILRFAIGGKGVHTAFHTDENTNQFVGKGLDPDPKAAPNIGYEKPNDSLQHDVRVWAQLRDCTVKQLVSDAHGNVVVVAQESLKAPKAHSGLSARAPDTARWRLWRVPHDAAPAAVDGDGKALPIPVAVKKKPKKLNRRERRFADVTAAGQDPRVRPPAVPSRAAASIAVVAAARAAAAAAGAVGTGASGVAAAQAAAAASAASAKERAAAARERALAAAAAEVDNAWALHAAMQSGGEPWAVVANADAKAPGNADEKHSLAAAAAPAAPDSADAVLTALRAAAASAGSGGMSPLNGTTSGAGDRKYEKDGKANGAAPHSDADAKLRDGRETKHAASPAASPAAAASSGDTKTKAVPRAKSRASDSATAAQFHAADDDSGPLRRGALLIVVLLLVVVSGDVLPWLRRTAQAHGEAVRAAAVRADAHAGVLPAVRSYDLQLGVWLYTTLWTDTTGRSSLTRGGGSDHLSWARFALDLALLFMGALMVAFVVDNKTHKYRANDDAVLPLPPRDPQPVASGAHRLSRAKNADAHTTRASEPDGSHAGEGAGDSGGADEDFWLGDESGDDSDAKTVAAAAPARLHAPASESVDIADTVMGRFTSGKAKGKGKGKGGSRPSTRRGNRSDDDDADDDDAGDGNGGGGGANAAGDDADDADEDDGAEEEDDEGQSESDSASDIESSSDSGSEKAEGGEAAAADDKDDDPDAARAFRRQYRRDLKTAERMRAAGLPPLWRVEDPDALPKPKGVPPRWRRGLWCGLCGSRTGVTWLLLLAGLAITVGVWTYVQLVPPPPYFDAVGYAQFRGRPTTPPSDPALRAEWDGNFTVSAIANRTGDAAWAAAMADADARAWYHPRYPRPIDCGNPWTLRVIALPLFLHLCTAVLVVLQALFAVHLCRTAKRVHDALDALDTPRPRYRGTCACGAWCLGADTWCCDTCCPARGLDSERHRYRDDHIEHAFAHGFDGWATAISRAPRVNRDAYHLDEPDGAGGTCSVGCRRCCTDTRPVVSGCCHAVWCCAVYERRCNRLHVTGGDDFLVYALGPVLALYGVLAALLWLHAGPAGAVCAFTPEIVVAAPNEWVSEAAALNVSALSSLWAHVVPDWANVARGTALRSFDPHLPTPTLLELVATHAFSAVSACASVAVTLIWVGLSVLWATAPMWERWGAATAYIMRRRRADEIDRMSGHTDGVVFDGDKAVKLSRAARRVVMARARKAQRARELSDAEYAAEFDAALRKLRANHEAAKARVRDAPPGADISADDLAAAEWDAVAAGHDAAAEVDGLKRADGDPETPVDEHLTNARAITRSEKLIRDTAWVPYVALFLGVCDAAGFSVWRTVSLDAYRSVHMFWGTLALAYLCGLIWFLHAALQPYNTRWSTHLPRPMRLVPWRALSDALCASWTMLDAPTAEEEAYVRLPWPIHPRHRLKGKGDPAPHRDFAWFALGFAWLGARIVLYAFTYVPVLLSVATTVAPALEPLPTLAAFNATHASWLLRDIVTPTLEPTWHASDFRPLFWRVLYRVLNTETLVFVIAAFGVWWWFTPLCIWDPLGRSLFWDDDVDLPESPPNDEQLGAFEGPDADAARAEHQRQQRNRLFARRSPYGGLDDSSCFNSAQSVLADVVSYLCIDVDNSRLHSLRPARFADSLVTRWRMTTWRVSCALRHAVGRVLSADNTEWVFANAWPWPSTATAQPLPCVHYVRLLGDHLLGRWQTGPKLDPDTPGWFTATFAPDRVHRAEARVLDRALAAVPAATKFMAVPPPPDRALLNAAVAPDAEVDGRPLWVWPQHWSVWCENATMFSGGSALVLLLAAVRVLVAQQLWQLAAIAASDDPDARVDPWGGALLTAYGWWWPVRVLQWPLPPLALAQLNAHWAVCLLSPYTYMALGYRALIVAWHVLVPLALVVPGVLAAWHIVSPLLRFHARSASGITCELLTYVRVNTRQQVFDIAFNSVWIACLLSAMLYASSALPLTDAFAVPDVTVEQVLALIQRGYQMRSVVGWVDRWLWHSQLLPDAFTCLIVAFVVELLVFVYVLHHVFGVGGYEEGNEPAANLTANRPADPPIAVLAARTTAQVWPRPMSRCPAPLGSLSCGGTCCGMLFPAYVALFLVTTGLMSAHVVQDPTAGPTALLDPLLANTTGPALMLRETVHAFPPLLHALDPLDPLNATHVATAQASRHVVSNGTLAYHVVFGVGMSYTTLLWLWVVLYGAWLVALTSAYGRPLQHMTPWERETLPERRRGSTKPRARVRRVLFGLFCRVCVVVLLLFRGMWAPTLPGYSFFNARSLVVPHVWALKRLAEADPTAFAAAQPIVPASPGVTRWLPHDTPEDPTNGTVCVVWESVHVPVLALSDDTLVGWAEPDRCYLPPPPRASGADAKEWPVTWLALERRVSQRAARVRTRRPVRNAELLHALERNASASVTADRAGAAALHGGSRWVPWWEHDYALAPRDIDNSTGGAGFFASHRQRQCRSSPRSYTSRQPPRERWGPLHVYVRASPRAASLRGRRAYIRAHDLLGGANRRCIPRSQLSGAARAALRAAWRRGLFAVASADATEPAYALFDRIADDAVIHTRDIAAGDPRTSPRGAGAHVFSDGTAVVMAPGPEAEEPAAAATIGGAHERAALSPPFSAEDAVFWPSELAGGTHSSYWSFVRERERTLALARTEHSVWRRAEAERLAIDLLRKAAELSANRTARVRARHAHIAGAYLTRLPLRAAVLPPSVRHWWATHPWLNALWSQFDAFSQGCAARIADLNAFERALGAWAERASTRVSTWWRGEDDAAHGDAGELLRLSDALAAVKADILAAPRAAPAANSSDHTPERTADECVDWVSGSGDALSINAWTLATGGQRGRALLLAYGCDVQPRHCLLRAARHSWTAAVRADRSWRYEPDPAPVRRHCVGRGRAPLHVVALALRHVSEEPVPRRCIPIGALERLHHTWRAVSADASRPDAVAALRPHERNALGTPARAASRATRALRVLQHSRCHLDWSIAADAIAPAEVDVRSDDARLYTAIESFRCTALRDTLCRDDAAAAAAGSRLLPGHTPRSATQPYRDELVRRTRAALAQLRVRRAADAKRLATPSPHDADDSPWRWPHRLWHWIKSWVADDPFARSIGFNIHFSRVFHTFI